MTAHKIETYKKPTEGASAADWEKYVSGLVPPPLGASDDEWDEYARLTEEAADESPDDTFRKTDLKAHPNLLGNGRR